MKTIFTQLITLTAILFFSAAQAQTYNITSNGNWSATLPNTCANCTINISSGVTLTVDGSFTCQNCTFQGGAVSMTNQTLNIQYTGGSPVTTYFNSTNLFAYGNSKLIVNAPLSLDNATFTFNNNASFTTSYKVDLTASQINLYDNSSMLATGSSATQISLINSSKIVVGNGSQASTAIITVSGPTLTLYDKSSLTVGNDNNVYYNWASYVTSPNIHANSNASNTYSTSSATINCGGSYPNACSNPALYGPVSLSSAGTTPGNALPVILTGFAVELNSNNTTTQTWKTMQEINFSHFNVERSQDGNSWNTIGTVQAKGNSATETDYSFTDQNPSAGVNYYRLKVIDLDGRYEYSEIKVLRNAQVNTISFFPNPARDYVNVALGEASGTQVTVRLINLAGMVLQERKAVAGNGTTISLPLQQCASGMYILSVSTADGKQESSKLLISRS